MATDLGVAYLAIASSSRGLGRDIERQVSGVGPGAGRKMGAGVMGGMAAAMGPLAGMVAAVGLAKMGASAVRVGVQTASAMEQAKISFTTMLGSAQKADSFIKQMVDFAAKTPFEMAGLQQSASQMIAAGISAEKVIPIMTTLGDVTSGMGTGSEGIRRAVIALQQMNAAGRITGEDLNQLRDAGIPVYDLLAAATGKSKAEVVKLAQAGKLGKKELDAMMKALETGKGLERFSGLMSKQSASLQGMWSTMKDTFAQGMAGIIKPLMPGMNAAIGGMTSGMKPALDGIAAGLTTAVPKVQAFFKAFSASAGPGIATALSPFGIALKAIGPILPQIGATFKTLGTTIGTTLGPVLKTVAPVVQQLSAALAGGLQVAILALLPALVQIATAVLPVFAQIIAAVVPVVLQLVQAFLPLIPIAAQLVTSLLPPITSLITGLLAALMPLVPAILGLVQAFMPIMAIVAALIVQLLPPLMAIINALIPPIVALVAELASALVPVFAAVGELVTALLPIIGGLITVIAAIVGAVLPVVAVIIGALIPVLGAVIGWLVRVVGAIVSFVAKGISLMTRWYVGVYTAIGKVIGFLGGLPGKIGQVFNGAGKWLVDTGANLIKGLWQGVSDTVGWLKDQIGNAMQGVIDSVKKAFDVHSPSKVFAKIGAWLTAGLAQGVTNTTSVAVSALSKMASTAGVAAADALLSASGAQRGSIISELGIPAVQASAAAGKAVASQSRSSQASAFTDAGSVSDKPITMDGKIIGWLKTMATGQAQIVLADESLNAQVLMA